MTIESVAVCDENIDQYKHLVLEFGGKHTTIQQQWDTRTDKTKPMLGLYTQYNEPKLKREYCKECGRPVPHKDIFVD